MFNNKKEKEMFKKQRLKTMLMLLAVACIACSCSKETTESSNPQKSEVVNDGICKGTNPNTPPPDIMSWPHVLDSLCKLSKFSEYNFHDFTKTVAEGNNDVTSFLTIRTSSGVITFM